MSEQTANEAGKVQSVLEQLTLREKVSLLSGANAWTTAAIERLGIPALVMTDGPHGVRATRVGSGREEGPATCFPTGISMAASWDPVLIERVGAALGEETLAMGCDILLGPCVNIVRTPLAGRNFESYSEDPYLAGKIGVAWVRGLQSQGVGASLKHFACNNQEAERMRGNSVVDERTMREMYLPAFEMVVKETQPWTVMCAYNRINGVYASQHNYLLNRILREEWGFEGIVVSDWGAVHTIVDSVVGGLDLEMPGPARYYGRLLEDAIRTWQVDESVIDAAAARILRMVVRSGRFEGDAPSGAVNTPGHQALARELAEGAITLLKNEGDVLPLDADETGLIALIGPNAAEGRIGGGGSSYVDPPYRVSPLEGLRAKLGPGTAVEYERGCDNWDEAPELQARYLTPSRGAGEGLFGEYFANTSLTGEPKACRVDSRMRHWFWGGADVIEGVSGDAFSVRWSGTLAAPDTGRFVLTVISSGLCRVTIGEDTIVDTSEAADTHLDSDSYTADERGFSTVTGYVELVKGQDYELCVEFVKLPETDFGMLNVRFAYAPDPEDDDRLEKAVELARRSDVAIVFGGMPQGFESEGQDRPDLELPGRQNELIEAIAAANPMTVVVLNCGAPVTMPWIDRVAAVVEAYYPGQEGGNAVANVLTGAVNPSGKLPVSFPKRLADTAAYLNYPGKKTVHYGEGVFVGYRYHDAKDIEPLFPFGHGLSYTSFEYRNLRVPSTAIPGEPVTVTVGVKNVGDRAGREVVQLYVSDVAASVQRPEKELKGFEKVSLEPGETADVSFVLDERSLAFYDPDQRAWVAEAGEFVVLVGSSSRDIRAVGRFELCGGSG